MQREAIASHPIAREETESILGQRGGLQGEKETCPAPKNGRKGEHSSLRTGKRHEPKDSLGALREARCPGVSRHRSGCAVPSPRAGIPGRQRTESGVRKGKVKGRVPPRFRFQGCHTFPRAVGPGRAGAGMAEPGSPMRLKEWLIAQIDSGRYPGLRWENRERTLFRIPWKHAAKQDYRQQQDAALFRVRPLPETPPPRSLPHTSEHHTYEHHSPNNK